VSLSFLFQSSNEQAFLLAVAPCLGLSTIFFLSFPFLFLSLCVCVCVCVCVYVCVRVFSHFSTHIHSKNPLVNLYLLASLSPSSAPQVDYEEESEAAEDEEERPAPQKVLTFYELDLGLNHVVRKWSDPVDASANLVLTVPGDTDGPGGVLVCSEDYLVWKNVDQPDVRVQVRTAPFLPPFSPSHAVYILYCIKSAWWE
jgi:hypothetical protein